MNWSRDLEGVLRGLEAKAGELRYQQHVDDLGRVRSIGDGIAHVEGLSQAMLDEMLVFSNGAEGQILDLDRDVVGCIIYGPDAGIGAGSEVFRTGRAATIAVGPATLGRAMDPLGRPCDGLGPIETRDWRLIEQPAPPIMHRQPVRQPLLTGIKAIDAAIPIGLGQRELILGDRENGKTSIAVDTIINQRDRGVACVYVCIGGKRASLRDIMDELQRRDALAHVAIVVADAADSAALRYLAPYAGASVAEWFAYRGQHALVVYDDLTRHAEAYRDLSLLLRRPPGRDAYPSDIFSAHARLLERAFKLSDSLGGGSVTALPIVETQRGNIADYIPTNLISITDGQLYLDAALFAEGQLPAIDIGRSVSRVGGSAQPGTMREAAANLRLDLAQYAEVKGFARFGAILDESTTRQLERGLRVTGILMQSERHPLPLSVEVAELWALKTGLLDDVAPADIAAFEQALLARANEFSHLDAAAALQATVDQELDRELRRWIVAAKGTVVDRGPGG
jgi:F-type H+-transporting ATPase subunit alpha